MFNINEKIPLLRISIINFSVSYRCTLRDKFYVLDEELSNEVIADSSIASVQGMHVSITLKKATEGK